MKLQFQLISISLALLATFAPPLAAQDAGSAEKTEIEAVTVSDPSIKVENLELLLEPLTKSELAAESEAWRDVVKANIQEMAKVNIAASSEEDADAKKALTDKLATLQEGKSSLLKRFDSVMTAFEAKGGDAEELRTYSKAVSGLNVTTGDTASKISVIQGWMKSEDGGIKWAKGAARFIVILLIFWFISSIVSRIVHRITDKHLNWSALLERFINKLVKRTIIAVGLLVALSSVGVNVSAILALIGGGAFIIGFALQDTLGNFAAGLMLLIYRPFDVGDVVEIGGVMGKVDNVSLVSTLIRTPDNKIILVPNKNVWGQVITNSTASAERRVDMVFGIGYGDDMDKARTILEGILSKHEKVLPDPAPVVKVNELADSSVNFVCRPWVKTADYWDVYWDVTRMAKEEFDAQGISIPFPQTDIHVHQVSQPEVKEPG